MTADERDRLRDAINRRRRRLLHITGRTFEEEQAHLERKREKGNRGRAARLAKKAKGARRAAG